MENGDKHVEHLEIATVKEGNQTHSADDIDWCVSLINCLCPGQFMNYSMMNLHCYHGIVAIQIGYPVEPYSLFAVEISSSTCIIQIAGGKLLEMHSVVRSKSESG